MCMCACMHACMKRFVCVLIGRLRVRGGGEEKRVLGDDLGQQVEGEEEGQGEGVGEAKGEPG